MSHFTVLVATKSPADVAAALQPYHEYECTGIKDQYVRFVPAEETEAELRAEHSNQLAQYPSSTKQDFGQWIEDYYGYELRDGVWGHETNPNKKWDYWRIGGRWGNSLILRSGECADQAVKGDVDFDAMLAKHVKESTSDYDAAAAILKGETFEPFATIRERTPNDIDGARTLYWQQPAVKQLSSDDRFRFFRGLDDLLLPRADYIRTTSRDAACMFAVLHAGIWHERGRMGWWATVSDDKKDRWPDEYQDIVASIPPTHWVTVVDCHI